jgi:carboxyl-terminal processing protease
MLMFLEAVRTIADRALQSPQPPEVVRGCLKAYVTTLDPHSDFLSADDYAAYRHAQNPDYGGVGMELVRDPKGAFVCMPYPGSPAEQAGLVDGDQLIAVDGHPCGGLSLIRVGPRVRGPSGTAVRLTVQGPSETAPRDVRVVRAPVQARSAVPRRYAPFAAVRIYAFTSQTAEELDRIVGTLDPDQPLVIDLRGNPGGDLFGAVDTARLFLAEGQPIVELRTRSKQTPFVVKNGAKHLSRPLYLLQDSRTASAAEVFVAALVGNGRAHSLGSRTFGKGTTQDLVELVDGSALVLTDGQLYGPGSRSFDGVGLRPMTELEWERTDRSDLLQLLERLTESPGRDRQSPRAPARGLP